MKHTIHSKESGLTLIEVTLVIAVILGLISVLFIGAAAYKRGTDRARCIINMTSVQKAVRSYANLYQLEVGDAIPKSLFVGAGKMIETDPFCPTAGVYTYAATVQPVGTRQLSCLVSGNEDHYPITTVGW